MNVLHDLRPLKKIMNFTLIKIKNLNERTNEFKNDFMNQVYKEKMNEL